MVQLQAPIDELIHRNAREARPTKRYLAVVMISTLASRGLGKASTKPANLCSGGLTLLPFESHNCLRTRRRAHAVCCETGSLRESDATLKVRRRHISCSQDSMPSHLSQSKWLKRATKATAFQERRAKQSLPCDHRIVCNCRNSGHLALHARKKPS